MPREYLLLTQCLRGFLYGLNPNAQPSQAFALQYSFFLRTSRLDTCLRRAGLLGSDAPPQKCKPINRSADSGGLATAFGWRPKASVVLRWISTDRRASTLAPSIEPARALSSHSLA